MPRTYRRKTNRPYRHRYREWREPLAHGITDPQRQGESITDRIARTMWAVQHDLDDEEFLARLGEVRDVRRDVEIATEKEMINLERT